MDTEEPCYYRGSTVMENCAATIESYLAQVKATLDGLPVAAIARVVEAIRAARRDGKHVLLFGNGGSAATAIHFACDLSKGAIVEAMPRIKAISLCDNMALLSAWTNDTAYEHVFAEQLKNLLEPGDVVIGISGSGNSPNVLNAMAVARAGGGCHSRVQRIRWRKAQGHGRYSRGRPQPLHGTG